MLRETSNITGTAEGEGFSSSPQLLRTLKEKNTMKSLGIISLILYQYIVFPISLIFIET